MGPPSPPEVKEYIFDSESSLRPTRAPTSSLTRGSQRATACKNTSTQTEDALRSDLSERPRTGLVNYHQGARADPISKFKRPHNFNMHRVTSHSDLPSLHLTVDPLGAVKRLNYVMVSQGIWVVHSYPVHYY